MKTKQVTIIISCIIVAALACAGIYFIPGMKDNSKTLTFSKESGFYENEISLKMTAPEGATIYYTTDGTVPTEQSNIYKEALKIKDRSPEPDVLSSEINVTYTDTFHPKEPTAKGTVVRAFAKYKDGKASDVITRTYFVGKDFCEKYNDIPVFSLSINPEDFYDRDKGIYVKGNVFNDWISNGGDAENTPTWEIPANFTQTGRDWEKPVHVELFEKEKATSFTQDMGIRIMGGASRRMEQKSFKLYARKDYGKGSIHYALFPGNTKNVDQATKLDQYDTFVLRNGGNDSWLTKFRHRYIQKLVADRKPCVHETRPCIVFINGEYWGIYTMTDDYSNKYIERNYDISKDNIVMYKRMLIEEGTEADRPLYDDMIKFAKKNDLSQDKNYEEISKMIDIDNLIDYFVTEIYIVNNDWINVDNNFRLWRSRTASDKPYEDGKWRYLFYDTEYSMGLYSQGRDYNVNSLKKAMTFDPKESVGSQQTLFKSLLKNENFKEKFVTTFLDMVNYNFSKERLSSLLDETVQEYEPYMPDYYARFGNTYPCGLLPNPMDAFYTSLKEMKLFLSKRNDFIPKMLKDTLHLKGNTVDVTVNVNDVKGGTVTINSIQPDFTKGAFKGQYFEDYQITLTATPSDGYAFKGWNQDSDSKENTISIQPGEQKNLEALFEKK